MKSLKIFLSVIGLLTLAACGGGSSTTATDTTVTGVDTAAQISVVTAN